MDFEEIKKLLKLGGGRCAVYREGEPAYIILTAAEFSKFLRNNDEKDKNISTQKIDEEFNFDDHQDFRIKESSLDDIKIEDLPL